MLQNHLNQSRFYKKKNYFGNNLNNMSFFFLPLLIVLLNLLKYDEIMILFRK